MKSNLSNYDQEELIIKETIEHARTIQDYLWGDMAFDQNGSIADNFGDWIRMFQKRVDKMLEIHWDDSSARVELRKRALQQAALSIKLLWLLDKERKEEDNEFRKAFVEVMTSGNAKWMPIIPKDIKWGYFPEKKLIAVLGNTVSDCLKWCGAQKDDDNKEYQIVRSSADIVGKEFDDVVCLFGWDVDKKESPSLLLESLHKRLKKKETYWGSINAQRAYLGLRPLTDDEMAPKPYCKDFWDNCGHERDRNDKGESIKDPFAALKPFPADRDTRNQEG